MADRYTVEDRNICCGTASIQVYLVSGMNQTQFTIAKEHLGCTMGCSLFLKRE